MSRCGRESIIDLLASSVRGLKEPSTSSTSMLVASGMRISSTDSSANSAVAIDIPMRSCFRVFHSSPVKYKRAPSLIGSPLAYYDKTYMYFGSDRISTLGTSTIKDV